MPLSRAELRFKAETTDHRMTVLLDEGDHRHLRFSAPESGMYAFELISTPGRLIYTGDMGTYVFAAEADMFDWVSGSKTISPRYWAEKVIAEDVNNPVTEYSADAFREEVRQQATVFYESADMDEAAAFAQALENEVIDHADYEGGAREALEEFEHEGFTFSDTRDLSFDSISDKFHWACHATLWGVRQHRNRNLLKAVA